MTTSRRLFLKFASACCFWRSGGAPVFAQAAAGSAAPAAATLVPPPFGEGNAKLDDLAHGEWWTRKLKGPQVPPPMEVPRKDVIAFCLYAQHAGVMKLTAQLYPLKPGESMEVRLETRGGDGSWGEIAKASVVLPGWSAHFRLEKWDAAKEVAFRLRHGAEAIFEGVFRKDPTEQETITVANLGCNSSRTTGLRPELVENLKVLNPDLLFFSGDQTYRHTQHTAGWIEFGLQFREVMRDRPTVSIPDDHDVGHPNLWGEDGIRSTLPGNADGGYALPVEYVNQVQRQQTWHLPDAADPAPLGSGITVYFTRMTLGGVDFAILEDRKFKTGPAGTIPAMGPRPDHINDPKYDPKAIDLPGLQLLGERQEKFLKAWTQDWTGASMKAVLSQTAFAGAVHLHGAESGRLLADLDCNGWPQSKRKLALQAIRRAQAVHLSGDQHLAVVMKHGIDTFDDGPFGFTGPALVNTTYPRWWHPEGDKAGVNRPENSPLPWTGGYFDGLGNRLTMLAYANPEDPKIEKKRSDGIGIARFHKKSREITFECYPRFSDAKQGAKAQFPGWPMTVKMADNDGRKPLGWLPKVEFTKLENPVVQVLREDTGEILYTVRISGKAFTPPVFALDVPYALLCGENRPAERVFTARKAVGDLPAAEAALVRF